MFSNSSNFRDLCCFAGAFRSPGQRGLAQPVIQTRSQKKHVLCFPPVLCYFPKRSFPNSRGAAWSIDVACDHQCLYCAVMKLSELDQCYQAKSSCETEPGSIIQVASFFWNSKFHRICLFLVGNLSNERFSTCAKSTLASQLETKSDEKHSACWASHSLQKMALI